MNKDNVADNYKNKILDLSATLYFYEKLKTINHLCDKLIYYGKERLI